MLETLFGAPELVAARRYPVTNGNDSERVLRRIQQQLTLKELRTAERRSQPLSHVDRAEWRWFSHRLRFARR